MIARRISVTVATLVCLGASPAAAAARSTVLFHLTDPRIDEASGIAAGIASPGVVYVHNDSGDAARFFALDARSGRTLGVYTVPGATNVDWEDICVAPDARGVASVWIGDIGDNHAARAEIDIYRVDEPHVDRTRSDVAARTSGPQLWRLRYPAGASDAESLAVSPTGAAYVITKSLSGSSTVYAVPARPDPTRVQVLREIGSVRFGFTATPGGPSVIGRLAATAADLSRDGRLLAVRTYTDAYLWRVHGDDVAAALRTAPVRIALPAEPQGEGIAFDGARLLVDSEHVGSAVYAVAVPAVLSAPTAPTGASPGGPTPSATAAPGSERDRSPGWVPIGAGVLVGVLAIVTGAMRSRSRRRR